MSSCTKRDRAGYIERTGGAEKAEQRRKALIARQSGYRRAEERKRHGLTHAQLATAMGVTPGRVSQIERGEVATIDAIARYIEALGGRLGLVASFGDTPSPWPPPKRHDGSVLTLRTQTPRVGPLVRRSATVQANH